MRIVPATSANRYCFASRLNLIGPIAAVVVCFLTHPLSAAISVQQISQPLDQGLFRATLRAVSTEGEIINGVNNPIIVPRGSGAGIHQVWMPRLGPTPTRAEHYPADFDATWEKYDSFWFFDTSNSLGVGGQFTETNDGMGGATGLRPNDGGEPRTGFGTMGFSGPAASKGFLITSGLQGTVVPLGQFVMKQDDQALVSLGVLDNRGGNTPIFNFVMSFYQNIEDRNLGDIVRGKIVVAQLLSLSGHDPNSWMLNSFTGPNGNHVTGANVDPTTGRFTWNSVAQPLGDYRAVLGPTFSGTPVWADVTFRLIPEPDALALVTVGLVGSLMVSAHRTAPQRLGQCM